MSYCNASFIKFDFLIFVCGHKHCILRVGITMTKNVYLGYPRTPTIEKAENISFQECVSFFQDFMASFDTIQGIAFMQLPKLYASEKSSFL